MHSVLSLKELKCTAARLEELWDDESVTVAAVNDAFRPAELDYLCRICAILHAIGVCTAEDLPEDLREDDDDA